MHSLYNLFGISSSSLFGGCKMYIVYSHHAAGLKMGVMYLDMLMQLVKIPVDLCYRIFSVSVEQMSSHVIGHCGQSLKCRIKTKKTKNKKHQHAVRIGDINTSAFSGTRMAGVAKHQLAMDSSNNIEIHPVSFFPD